MNRMKKVSIRTMLELRFAVALRLSLLFHSRWLFPVPSIDLSGNSRTGWWTGLTTGA